MSDANKPKFLIRLGAEDNSYYFSGSALSERAEYRGGGSYVLPDGSSVEIRSRDLPGGASRVQTVLTNATDHDIDCSFLSSSFTDGIGADGSRPWKKHRFVIHFAYSCWQGEAQWRHVYAEDAGLYRTYNHGTQSSFRISSESTWSTSRYEPVVMVEDTEKNETYYAEVEAGWGWCLNVGVRGYRDDISLCITATDCAERVNGRRLTLAPGESAATCYSTVGRTDGGFEEAAAALTQARRAICRAAFPDGVPPLCFNDYMNCLWALPTRDKTIPLAKAAADLGCEYYVIDAGWYNVNKNDEADLGMWEVDDTVFGERGLKGVFDDIKKLGMKPGIWFEFESAGAESAFVKDHPGYILRRRGSAAGGRRVLLDFRIPGVRDHIEARVEALYNMGVRYIKNDYNANTGAGIDPYGAQSVRDHAEAFGSFVDRLRERFPDFLIENCGSGAMRSDMETLSRFHLQSVSDQEDYFRLPSIVSGSQACIPPERCGVWAYPYPVPIDLRSSFRPSPEFTARFADGRVTVYNCVTGLMGLMYLSGHIDCADGYNVSLMREAARLYKKYRKNTAAASPVYPTGTFDLDSDGVDSFGLLDREGKTLTIAVWNNSGDTAGRVIDLSKYLSGGSVETVFPRAQGYGAELDGAALRVTLPQGPSAVFAAIRLSV